MAGHFVGPDVTSGPTPALHAGVSTKFASFTLGKTASLSTSIALCNIPAGAKVVNAVLSWDNDDLSTTTGAKLALQTWTGGNNNGALIASAAVSTNPQLFNPAYAMINYRHTASSQAVLLLTDEFVGTGTATTVFKLMIQYECTEDGD